MAVRRDPLDRDRWARLRFSIIGPLLAAPPQPGELRAALAALSAKTWRHPSTAVPISFGVSTIERWFYAARRATLDPVAALKTRVRADSGQQRVLLPALIETLTAQYRDHPGWSCQLHYDNLGAALADDIALPSYTTVRRYLKAQGLFKKSVTRHRLTPGQIAAEVHLHSREVRSFEVDHVGALWHLDFHHGSRKVLTRCGEWVTPMALAILDDRSRLACHVPR